MNITAETRMKLQSEAVTGCVLCVCCADVQYSIQPDSDFIRIRAIHIYSPTCLNVDETIENHDKTKDMRLCV